MNRVKCVEEDRLITAASRCVEDTLEAALRGAFEVALEIALKEISRLMNQAINDVQQKNITNEPRLQQNHTEQEESEHITDDQNRIDVVTDASVNVCEEPDKDVSCEKLRHCFHEIGDDGYLLSYEAHTLDNEKDTPHPEEEFKRDHIQHVQSNDQEPSLFQPVFEQVHVKKENPEPEVLDGSSGRDVRPDCCFDPRSNEEFGLDRIDLVQSKLLEDWRPDTEQQHSETGPLDQTQSLDIALGTPEVSLSSTGCVSTFGGLYQSPDKTSLIQPPQNSREQARKNIQSSLCVCKFCGHSFHSESELNHHHNQYHHNNTVLKTVGNSAHETRPKKLLFPPGCSPYHCTVCNRDFNRMENLKTHLRIHTGERPFSCSVCGVRFRHGGALTRHFRIHTGEKPYVCSECGKSFRNCGGLRFHQKSHSKAVHLVSK